MPRASVLIQGQPRFCREFDQFISEVTDPAWQVDWYFYLWNPNPRPDVYGFELIADSWRNYTPEWAQDKIQLHLPPNHRIQGFETADQSQLAVPDFTRRAGETNVANVWRMFFSQYQVNELRRRSGQHYDLVIRGRPDVSVQGLDLNQCLSAVNQQPRQVIISNNNHYGYWGTRLNDWSAVCTPQVMNDYSSLILHLVNYYNQGMLYHPESMLSYHLAVNNIAVTYGDYSVNLRHLGHRDSSDIYHSDFGSWA